MKSLENEHVKDIKIFLKKKKKKGKKRPEKDVKIFLKKEKREKVSVSS